MATLIQKLVALEKRCAVATHAVDRLGHLVGRAKCYVMDEELQLTATQRAGLLDRYADLLAAAREALDAVPADPATFEPDPSEYENEV